MDAAGPFQAIWQWIQDHLPAPVAALPGWAQAAIVLGIVGIGAIVCLVILVLAIRAIFGRRKSAPRRRTSRKTCRPIPTP